MPLQKRLIDDCFVTLKRSDLNRERKKNRSFHFPNCERQDWALKEDDKFGSPAERASFAFALTRALLSQEKCHLQCLSHLHACLPGRRLSSAAAVT